MVFEGIDSVEDSIDRRIKNRQFDASMRSLEFRVWVEHLAPNSISAKRKSLVF